MAQQRSAQLIPLDLFPEAGVGFKRLDKPLLQRSETSKLCNICSNTVDGVVLQCVEKNIAVHPKCAVLKKEIKTTEGGFVFDLLRGKLDNPCNHCWKTDQGFHYKSRRGNYAFHVNCMTKMYATAMQRKKKKQQQRRKRKGKQINDAIDLFYSSLLSAFDPTGGLLG